MTGNTENHQEGDRCADEGCKGVLKFEGVVNCSCHINPPCSACTDEALHCPVCGWVEEKILEDSAKVKSTPYVFERRELDKTKIDWHNLGHTHFSMIKEGVYPEGTTKSQVLEKVKGTFGGRFAYFGNGKFKYIAYTD